jgi:serine/threonine protein kinase
MKKSWDKTDPVFADYFVRFSEKLGGGADGVVLLAVPTEGGGAHALKVVSRQAYGLKAELAVLRALARRPHQHVVKLLADYPPHGSRPQHVLAFPLADMDLLHFLRRPVGLARSRPLADALGGQVLDGIAHLHSMRLLHRDLKPANILVSFTPPGPRDTAGSIGVCLQIADFSRARFVVLQRVRAKRCVQKAVGPLTCGVATLSYAAPELLGYDDPDTAEYGFGVDLWSFGCVYFELVEKQRFVPDDGVVACRRCIQQRLGPPPAGAVFWPPPSRDTAGVAAVAELDAHKAVAWHPWIAGTLRWKEEHRRGAQNLQVEAAILSDDVPASPVTARPAQVARTSAGDLPESKHTPLFRRPESAVHAPLLRPRRPPEVVVVRGHCGCAGHCYQPKHRTQQGCSSDTVVAGSGYCELCGCSVPGCLRPRLRGPFCHKHGKSISRLPPSLVLARSLRVALPNMLPTVTSLPHFVERASRDRDLGSLVLSALISSPAQDVFNINMNGSQTDEQLVAELRKQYDAAKGQISGRLGSRLAALPRRRGRATRGRAMRDLE